MHTTLVSKTVHFVFVHNYDNMSTDFHNFWQTHKHNDPDMPNTIQYNTITFNEAQQTLWQRHRSTSESCTESGQQYTTHYLMANLIEI